ncbi:MAG: hypothetical protein Q9M26_09070 [Mariprofundales bacterium]|nr:hypothetical protein [Mariprofundales bacterium]
MKVFRYLCHYQDCGRTCSCLPECIPPRRHYLWDRQQAALVLVMLGKSIKAIIPPFSRPSLRTINRWKKRLFAKYNEHHLHLCSRYPELGKCATIESFWIACFEQVGMMRASFDIHQAREAIP